MTGSKTTLVFALAYSVTLAQLAYGVVPPASLLPQSAVAASRLRHWCDAQAGLVFRSSSTLGDNVVGGTKAAAGSCYMLLRQLGGNQMRESDRLIRMCENYEVPAGWKVHAAYVLGDWLMHIVRHYLNNSASVLGDSHGYGVGLQRKERKRTEPFYHAGYGDGENAWDRPFNLTHLWDDGEPTESPPLSVAPRVYAFIDHNTYKLKSVGGLREGIGVCQAYHESSAGGASRAWFRRAELAARPLAGVTVETVARVKSVLVYCLDRCRRSAACSAVAYAPGSELCHVAIDVLDDPLFSVPDSAYHVYHKLAAV